MTVTTVADLSVFIKESRDGLVREGGLGAIFAVLTIFLFLFSLRATIVAAISIPLSILTALVIMQLTGVTINIMTLGGLAVAVGRVVDDAIVVLENIYRHRPLGEDRLTASINGPREVAGAITASTLTTVARLPAARLRRWARLAVLPAVRADRHVRAAGVAGLRADRRPGPRLLPDPDGQAGRRRDRRADAFDLGPHSTRRPSSSSCAAGRPSSASSLGAGVLFFASLALAPLLPTQFINAGSEKTLIVTIAPPTGASSAAVLDQAIAAETILLADPAWSSSRRASRPRATRARRSSSPRSRAAPANSATMTVRLKSDVGCRRDTTAELAAALEPVRTDGYDATIVDRRVHVARSRHHRHRPDAADVDTATTAILAASPTSRTSSTSRATSSRRRPRSRSRSTRTRPSRSG